MENTATPLLTVIIPVYKSQDYLERCLDSVIHQTYTHQEIIAVNDGSPDDSLTILERYATSDRRIKVFSKENEGAGAARNYALDKISGEYVTFVDSDDWLDPNYFNEIMGRSLAASRHFRLACGGFRLNYDGTSYHYDTDYYNIDVASGIERLYFTYFGMIYNIWGKKFRTDIIQQHHLTFRSNFIEDGIFLMDYLLHVNKMNLISTRSYLHCNTTNINSCTKKEYRIETLAVGLYTFHLSMQKLAEKDFSNYDRYSHIIDLERTMSYLNLLRILLNMPRTQRLYWLKRMIHEIPHLTEQIQQFF